LTEAGPLIVRLSLTDSEENLLAEVPDFHRLWHAPETADRTYIPDDTGLTIEETSSRLHLIQPTETATNLRKNIA
jgi:hypothetical protein